jgi:mono/diheme cytochrome c family protein
MIAKILVTFAAIAMLCTPGSSNRALAGNVYRGHGSYVANHGVFIPQTFVVTQFAVPVGVPVAPRSYVYYQAGGCQVMAPPLHQVPARQPAQPQPVQPQPVPVQQQPAQQPVYQPPVGQQPVQPQPAPVQPAPQQPVQPQPVQPQPEQPAAQPPAQQPPAQPDPTQPLSMLATHCATCHRADSHRLTLIDAKSLTCEQKIDAIHRLLSNDPNERMPKGKVLTPEELGQILQELSEPGTATSK